MIAITRAQQQVEACLERTAARRDATTAAVAARITSAYMQDGGHAVFVLDGVKYTASRGILKGDSYLSWSFRQDVRGDVGMVKQPTLYVGAGSIETAIRDFAQFMFQAN